MLHGREFPEFISLIKRPKYGKPYNWLIVMPKITALDDQQYNFPVGIAYVSSALKVSGRNVFTLNMNYKSESMTQLLRQEIEGNNIDVIATGGITTQYPLIKEIVGASKEIKPDITTVVGGGIVTSAPEHAMTALEYADYGVVGEGEMTVCDLAYALETGCDPETVKGIVYRAANEWKTTAPREEIQDLDVIPWPDYDGFEYAEMLVKTPMDILTAGKPDERLGMVFYSRSCPYNCTFCFHSSGKKYRTRSMDSFFEEFDYLMRRYAFDGFFLADEYFIRSLEFVEEFSARMKPYGLRWSCSGRVDNITEELLAELKDAGCYRIGFGVESVNDRILKSMRKHITRAQIETAFELCHKVGVEAQGNLIFGDLEETAETATDTVNWWKSHQDWALTMHWIIAYPGSYIHRVCLERGIISDPVKFIQDGCPEVNFSKMTDDERRQIAAIISALTSEVHDYLSDAKIIPSKSGKVTISGKCPFCGTYGKYHDVDLIRPIKAEICPSCRRGLRLYAYDYIDKAAVARKAGKLTTGHKTALWPVVTGVAKLFEMAPSFDGSNVWLVDSSAYKQGTEVCGKDVRDPGVIREENIDTVLLTVTTSISLEIMSRINAEFPSVKRVCLLGDIV
jgi:radical SAM superfamily enzyme YgiQ (UPF0313 family)